MKSHLISLVNDVRKVSEESKVKDLRALAREVHAAIRSAEPKTPGQQLDYAVLAALTNNAFISRDIPFMVKAIQTTLPALEEIAGIPFQESHLAYV